MDDLTENKKDVSWDEYGDTILACARKELNIRRETRFLFSLLEEVGVNKNAGTTCIYTGVSRHV